MTAIDYTAIWHLGDRDTRSVTVKIPLRTQSENNMREHHMARARRRKKQREVVHLVVGTALRAEGIKPPCVVELVRIAPKRLDSDNLQGAFKAVRDQVAAELGVDDRTDAVRWVYDQSKGGVREYAIRVTIRTEIR